MNIGWLGNLLEVKQRDGLARVVVWEVMTGSKVLTPLVLHIPGPRSGRFDLAEMTLDEGLGIPDSMSCPMTFSDYVEDEGELGDDERVMLVGPKPPSDLPKKVELVVSGNIQSLLGDPKRLVGFITTLRERIGYSRLIYAPAVGDPVQMALLSYLGIDVFDTTTLTLCARKGRMLFPSGSHSRKDVISSGLCNCPACSGVIEDEHEMNLHHNHLMALQESRLIGHAISQGTIRELVEARVRAEPWQVAAMRELDLRHHDMVERYLPISKPFLLASSRESLHRPEVVRFQRRLRQRYRRPPSSDILLLLPCSARKPYSTSATHRAISDALSRCVAPARVHKVVLTSPLGVVPMDLELFYPANVYDIAVTGDWDGPEIDMIRDGLSWLVPNGDYGAVVSYIDSMPFIDGVIKDNIRVTRTITPKDPRRRADLDTLVKAIDEVVEEIGGRKVGRKKRNVENVGSLARFQFGPGAEDIVTSMNRSRDQIRLFRNDGRTGTLNQDRGLISLTMGGGEFLGSKGLYCVEIEDFEPKGTVFAVGVKKADHVIRVGDDVVVKRDGAVIGVGISLMSGPEMTEANRGGAIKLRHRKKKG